MESHIDCGFFFVARRLHAVHPSSKGMNRGDKELPPEGWMNVLRNNRKG